MADIPKHPVEVTINIGGESWEYVLHRIRDLYLEAGRRTPNNFQMFGGGSGGSYSVTTTTRDINREEYRAELEKWFEQQK